MLDEGEPAFRRPAVENEPGANHAQAAGDRVGCPYYRRAQADVDESHESSNRSRPRLKSAASEMYKPLQSGGTVG